MTDMNKYLLLIILFGATLTGCGSVRIVKQIEYVKSPNQCEALPLPQGLSLLYWNLYKEDIEIDNRMYHLISIKNYNNVISNSLDIERYKKQLEIQIDKCRSF